MHLVWHRGALRVHDHPALNAALAAGEALGLVVLDPTILDATTARRRAWFAANVRALRERYRELGGTLLVRQGLPWEVLPDIAARTGAIAVHALASYTPYGRHRDDQTEAALEVPLRWYPGNYLYEPGTVVKDDGNPYTVYTPFARRARREPLPSPLEAPTAIAGHTELPAGDAPEYQSDIALPEAGETAALEAYQRFRDDGLERYHQERDGLDGNGASRLSPYLTIGVLSPRLAAAGASLQGGPGADKWIAELQWRDFMADLLYRFPHLRSEPFDRRWQALPWNEDRELFDAWKLGETGVPAVDAAMRELQASGWISNRARMVTAQFLVKYLLLPWQWGEQLLRDWLLDGDAANNVGGWQWAGGLGVDAAPYFRVFNLETQASKHDPDGSWRQRWLPSGSDHHAGEPIVDLHAARQRYLAAAKEVNQQAADIPPALAHRVKLEADAIG